MSFDAERYVAKFVQLRDTIEAMEKEHKEKLQPFKDMKEKLENMFLEKMNEDNVEGFRCPSGSVYRLERKSSSLEDPAAFRRYVIGEQAWDLLDWKSNVKAVEDFIVEHGAPPPGAKFSSRLTVGVRRS